MKKKLVTLLCVVCLGIVSLAGCGKGADTQVKESPASVSETADGKDVGANTVNNSEGTKNDKAEPAVPHDYKSVLNGIYEYIHDFDFVEPVYGDDQYGMFENIYYGGRDKNVLTVIGYALKDLTGDGDPELLIISPDYDYDPEGSAGMNVLNIYGYVNDEPVVIKNGYSRDCLWILEDGTVYETTSQNAFCGGVCLFKLKSNSTDTEIIDFRFSYAFEEDNYTEKYYTNKEGSYDYEKSEQLDISEEEYWDYIAQMDSHIETIDITLFKDYEYTGENKYVIPDRTPVVTAGWADDAMPSIPDYVDPEIDIYSWQGTPVVFSTNTAVKDFTLWAIEIYDVDEEGNPKFYCGDILDMGTLTPEEDKLVIIDFPGDLPQYAVSYREADGTFKRFSVSISGYDGSLVLEELK